MIFTFGKHRGQSTEEVSSNYLEWISEHLDPDKYANEDVIDACDQELAYRTKNNCYIGDD